MLQVVLCRVCANDQQQTSDTNADKQPGGVTPPTDPPPKVVVMWRESIGKIKHRFHHCDYDQPKLSRMQLLYSPSVWLGMFVFLHFGLIAQPILLWKVLECCFCMKIARGCWWIGRWDWLRGTYYWVLRIFLIPEGLAGVTALQGQMGFEPAPREDIAFSDTGTSGHHLKNNPITTSYSQRKYNNKFYWSLSSVSAPSWTFFFFFGVPFVILSLYLPMYLFYMVVRVLIPNKQGPFWGIIISVHPCLSVCLSVFHTLHGEHENCLDFATIFTILVSYTPQPPTQPFFVCIWLQSDKFSFLYKYKVYYYVIVCFLSACSGFVLK